MGYDGMSLIVIIVLLQSKDMFTGSPSLARYFETEEKQACKQKNVLLEEWLCTVKLGTKELFGCHKIVP